MQNLKLFENKKLQIIIICLFAVIPYLNIFQNGFVIDDKAFVGWADSKSMSEIGNILTGEVPFGHEGVFRPIRGVLYYLYASISTNPTIFHLHSIFINLICSILIYLIASRILKSPFLGFLVTLIFASHPVHTEAITYISSSMDTTGFVFMLLSFYLYLITSPRASLGRRISRISIQVLFERSRELLQYMLSIIFALLAFFTYEMTLTLPLLVVLYDVILMGKWPRRISRFESRNLSPSTSLRIKMTFKKSFIYLPYFLALGLYFLVRISFVGISGRAPYPGDSVYITFLTMLKIFVEYIKLIFLPIAQINNHILPGNIESFIYRGYNISNFKTQSLLSLDILSYLIIYIAIFIICLKTFKKYPIISFCVGAFFILMSPASEIIPQGSVMNERLIYGASFPIILLFVWVLNRFFKERSLLLATVLVISLILGFLTYQRNLDWKNEIVLWNKDIMVNPNANAYAYFQLGNALRNNGDYKEAVKNYQKSYQINSNFSVAFASLAQTYDLAGYKDQALNLYSELLKKDPYFWESYRERGKIFMQQKKFDEAKTEFKTLLMIYPSNQEAQQFLLVLESMRLENEKRK